MNQTRRFYGPNIAFALELYEQYLRDPASVDAASRALFEQWGPPVLEEAAPAQPAVIAAPAAAVAPAVDVRAILNAAALARSIRSNGHLAAQINPLEGPPPGDPALEPAAHSLTERDLVNLPASVVGGPAAQQARSALEALQALRQIYCGVTGYELDQVTEAGEREWLQEAVESGRFHQPLSPEASRSLLQRLTLIDTFERVMHQAFPGQTRFSIEGLDILVPMLDELLALAAASGANEMHVGMAHRGRLNVLAHIMGKTYGEILSEFRRAGVTPVVASEEELGAWMGDVKYHLGGRQTVPVNGRNVYVAMAANPSHLEFVDPVIEGMVRAIQEDRTKPGVPSQDVNVALAVLVHGDASFPGQGIVAETLNLAGLPGYTTGGTVHIISNNQLGFTTEPGAGHATRYSSDLAKGFGIPVVHVNADEPDACLAAVRLAHAYRQRFHKDFLIDLVGYRRWGHNEGDEPAFTQPHMYEVIQSHPRVRDLWAQRLVAAGVMTLEETEALAQAVNEQMQEVRAQAAQAGESHGVTQLTSYLNLEGIATAVPAPVLIQLNQELLTMPDGFSPNPRQARVLEQRRTTLEAEGGIQWGHAESLALASILADGTPIRLTGQDTERGTFSQRHVVLHSASDEPFLPLQSIPSARASFYATNSPLSENAAMGFEFGYGVAAPEALVLWEAQYGDFANGAQVIIDQFISSARSKWGDTPSLVLLLPHAYEGQGPEHSSARLERFLQLAADDNIRVVYPSNASQYFHLLRRQAALLEQDPRPLVVMTPKSLLRLPRAGASLQDLADGSFQSALDDSAARERATAVTRLVFCTGKVYYDLTAPDARAAAESAAVVRIEELYPFPTADVQRILAGYPNVREAVWVQEEPKNMGAWTYVAPRLRAVLGRDLELSYVGRVERSSPAEGTASRHAVEQSRIVRAAFGSLGGVTGGGEPPVAQPSTR